MIRPPPRSTLFPYTTLFRSVPHDLGDLVDVAALQLLDVVLEPPRPVGGDRKSTRLNSSHTVISYAVFCLKKKNTKHDISNAVLKKIETTKPRANVDRSTNCE